MRHSLTAAAERDIRNILRETIKAFGVRQLSVYAGIIDRGIELVTENPERGGSLDRSRIAADVRLFHLELAAGRRGAAAHCLYYIKSLLPDGSSGVIILRVLHESMEPRHKIIRALGDDQHP